MLLMGLKSINNPRCIKRLWFIIVACYHFSNQLLIIWKISLGFWEMKAYGIEVVSDSCLLFTWKSSNVLLILSSIDEDLPVLSIFRDPNEGWTSIFSNLKGWWLLLWSSKYELKSSISHSIIDLRNFAFNLNNCVPSSPCLNFFLWVSCCWVWPKPILHRVLLHSKDIYKRMKIIDVFHFIKTPTVFLICFE